MFDIVIVGGTLVEGTGSPGYRADVGVAGETVEAIGGRSHCHPWQLTLIDPPTENESFDCITHTERPRGVADVAPVGSQRPLDDLPLRAGGQLLFCAEAALFVPAYGLRRTPRSRMHR